MTTKESTNNPNSPTDTYVSGSDLCVIGVDYGTLSGRAVVVRVRDGKELGSAVHEYPHAVVTDALPKDTAGDDGARLPGEWALQVPNDYREVLRTAVPAAVADAGVDPAAVVGIATDFTACTMVPVKAEGTPLNEVA
ncbi:ribulokinase, partial [Pseudarthrobacter phenanthrenivorans]